MKQRLLILLLPTMIALVAILSVNFFLDSSTPPNKTSTYDEAQWERLHKSGFHKRENGDFDGAIDDFTKAIQMEPGDTWSYSQRAVAKESKGDFDGAIADYTTDITLRNQRRLDVSNEYKERAAVKRIEGNFKGAVADYTAVFKINSGLPIDTLYLRGIANYLDGNFPGALSDFRSCIKLTESTDRLGHRSILPQYAHIDIWIVLMKLGRTTEANQELQDYVDNGEKQTASYKRMTKEDAELLAHSSPGITIIHKNDFDEVANFLLDRKVDPDFLRPNKYSDIWIYSHYYYAGMKALLVNENATAVEFFQKYLAYTDTYPQQLRFVFMSPPCGLQKQLSEIELKRLKDTR